MKVAKLRVAQLRFLACGYASENATRNPQLFLIFLLRARVYIHTLYIKIKIKKNNNYIGLQLQREENTD